MKKKNQFAPISYLLAALLFLPIAGRSAEPLSDIGIKDAIAHQFVLDSTIPARDVDVAVREGIAELTGRVNNLLAKERSTYIAEHVRGVRAVSNRIEVSPESGRTDSEIKTEIVRELALDPATDSYEVQTTVANHVATLTGIVHSFAEKELAGKVAKGVDGVVSVDNQLQIQYREKRLDGEIRNDVEQRLRWDALVDNGQLNVAVNNGQVALSGTVGSAAEKRQAMWDAWVFGVTDVDTSGVSVDPLFRHENLRVNKYKPMPDSAIREAVKDATLFDPRVYSFNVTPSVEDGWVTLTGSVDNLIAKRTAEQLARNTVGVRGVTNLLDVRPDRPRSDSAIAADVRAALIKNQYTDSMQLKTSVRDGIVTLRGEVETPFEKSEAERVASAVRGARSVFNFIDVDGIFADLGTSYYFPTWYPPAVRIQVMEKTDATLQEDVRQELFWSPFVDSDKVTVNVQNGIVTLSGTVDSWREYRAAEENTFEAGATSVINNLDVKLES